MRRYVCRVLKKLGPLLFHYIYFDVDELRNNPESMFREFLELETLHTESFFSVDKTGGCIFFDILRTLSVIIAALFL